MPKFEFGGQSTHLLRKRRSRRAAFAPIAGLIIFGILFTSVFGYYYTTSQFQQLYQNSVKNQEKNTVSLNSEDLIVYGSLTPTQYLDININNTGPSVSIVAYWIYNATNSAAIQYENTTTTTKLPLYVGQGQAIEYTNTNISITNLFTQLVIKVLTSQGGVFTGTFPSQQLVSASINSLVSGGIGSLRMTFSSFSWYSYVSGPPSLDPDGDFNELCSNGQMCGGSTDGSAYNTSSCNSVSKCSLTLSTTTPNDVIILTGYETSSSAHISSIADNGGLTWHMRKQLSSSGQNSMTEEWYAVANKALSSDVITATYSQSTTGGITAFAISGANTNTIFDPSLSSGPKTNTGSSSNPSVSISTSNANDIIIGIVSCSSSASISTYNSYTQAGGPSNPNCNNNMAIPEYQAVSSTQGGNVRFSLSNSRQWSMIADAIMAGGWVVDISHPHQGTLVPQGQNSTGNGCGYCGSMVPLVFSLNITNYDPSGADLVINSQANLWVIETCDTATFANNCPQGNPVYVFYIVNVNQTTGAITTLNQGSFSQINIPYGSTKTLYFAAAYDITKNSFQSMSLSSDDSLYAGNNLAYYGEFAVFILFSGTKIPPANIYVYGQNIPFQTTISADNLGWYAQSPTLCLTGSPTTFSLQVNNSVFSGYSINKIYLNASALSSVGAAAPTGWSESVSNGQITWTNTNSNYLINPGGTLTFTWSGTSPSVPTTTEITFPMLLSFNGGGLQNLEGASACFD